MQAEGEMSEKSKTLMNIGELTRAVCQLFHQVSHMPIDQAEVRARRFVQCALAISPLDWLCHLNTSITPEAQDLWISLRDRWEDPLWWSAPPSRLAMRSFFWKHYFMLNEDTLDPRWESENLVRLALNFQPQRILDLGTGTGCIILSLLHELSDAYGVGVDISSGALAIASRNAIHLGLQHRVKWVESHWWSAFEPSIESFDCIVANPPYVRSHDVLPDEVRLWDPMRALDGGPDGLMAYKDIISKAGAFLKPDGVLLLEIGHDQATAISLLLSKLAFDKVDVLLDAQGYSRYICAQKTR